MAMADRIAVMNAGRIDQLDVPSAIYDRPATPFVADFIGDMNHLEGTLEREADALVASVGAARFGIGRVVEDAAVGDRVRVGLRPEEVHANTRGEGIPATCQTAMVLGHNLQIVAVLETGEEMVARRAPGGHRARRQAVARLEPDCHPAAGAGERRERHDGRAPRTAGMIYERKRPACPIVPTS